MAEKRKVPDGTPDKSVPARKKRKLSQTSQPDQQSSKAANTESMPSPNLNDLPPSVVDQQDEDGDVQMAAHEQTTPVPSDAKTKPSNDSEEEEVKEDEEEEEDDGAVTHTEEDEEEEERENEGGEEDDEKDDEKEDENDFVMSEEEETDDEEEEEGDGDAEGEEEKQKNNRGRRRTSSGTTSDMYADFKAIGKMEHQPDWFQGTKSQNLCFPGLLPTVRCDMAHSYFGSGNDRKLKYRISIQVGTALFAALAHAHIHGITKYRPDKSSKGSKCSTRCQVSGWEAIFWFLFMHPEDGLQFLIDVEQKFKEDKSLNNCPVCLFSFCFCFCFFLLFRKIT